MVRKIVLSLIAVLGLCAFSYAQKQQVVGVVTDTAGDPIAGATILVEGTNNGTTSGEDGRFAIRADKRSQLIVSFLGYHTLKVPVGKESFLKIALKEDLHAIDDVIVVAFGTTTKEAFTGSASVVKADDLQNRQTSSVIKSLAGVVPGLQTKGSSGTPGGGLGFTSIRGFSSMNAERDPLIIVDGAPYEGNMSYLNQADIASVTVLKDAASAALYGARGAAGVILITTKKGSSRDAVVNVDMKVGVNTRANQRYDVIKNPGHYYEAYYNQAYNKYFYGDMMSAEDANIKANQLMMDNLAYNVYNVPAGETLIGLDGRLNPNATLGNVITHGGKEYLLRPDNWDDEIYRSSVRQDYNVSLSGQTDRMNYYLSLGYLRDEGIVSKSDYTRVAARLKADYQAKKWLKVGANFSYINGEHNSNGAGMIGYAESIAPIYPMYMRDGKGKILKDQYGYTGYDYGNGGNAGLKRPIYRNTNPLGQNALDSNNGRNNEFNAYGFAEFTFVKGLKLNIDGNYFFKNFNSTAYVNGLYGSSVSQEGIVSRSMQNNYSYNLRQSLSYTTTFGEDHHFQAMIGHEYFNQKTDVLSAAKHKMFSSAIKELDGAMIIDDAKSSNGEYNTEGYFGQINYDYANKYYASFSYRRDASSYFHPDHRWGNFWSLGAAWLINKEKFMHNATWIDMLKLKLSYGEQGNDNIGSFMYTTMYKLVLAGDKISTNFLGFGNPEITWETTGNLNVGVEFSLFKGRLTGSFDWYNKTTSDMLQWVSAPESSGARGMFSNIGDVRNYGYEIDLHGRILEKKDLTWDVNFNIAHNRNKITKLAESRKSSPKESHYYYKEGLSMYNLHLKSFAGLDEYGETLFWGKPDENGVRPKVHDYNEADDIVFGNTLAQAFGGFGTTIRFKGFDLSMMFDYQIGGWVYDGQYASLMGVSTKWQDSGVAMHRDVAKSWSPQNTSSRIPRQQYGDKYTNTISDRWMVDASYLNFQSLTFGYTLPKSFTSKFKVSSLRVYFAAENICFWSRRKGFDPRSSFGGIASTNRHETGMPSGLGYAPIRTLSAGLQVTF